jgi:hypothetical protein
MLHGGPIDDLWRSEVVEEALDLCLGCKGCKGCKSDCPVNTDMATYKAEFRAHQQGPVAAACGVFHGADRRHCPAAPMVQDREPGGKIKLKKAAHCSRKYKPLPGEPKRRDFNLQNIF